MSSFKSVVRAFLPRKVRPHRILSGPLRGARIVTSWHDYPAAILGLTEVRLLQWFQANVQKGETWLDVGAHYGYTALALSELVGPAGRVFAFEPVVATAAHLQSTREANLHSHLTIVPVGLGTTPILSRRTSTVERGMATHGRAASLNTDLYIVALDGLWPGICGGNLAIHGVKIDVQGMEQEVIAGMFTLLRTWQPRLIVEFHTGADRKAILHTLGEIGYKGTGIAVDGLTEAQPDFGDDQSYIFVAVPPA
jgi:FkbM family methyltransferase